MNARPQPVGPSPGGPGWVLVVDDDAAVATAIARLVAWATGAQVCVAVHVADALSLTRGPVGAPLAALLDFELVGGRTGIEVVIALRVDGCHCPVAFHSGSPARARAALAACGVGGGPPVFAKGAPLNPLVAWLKAIVACRGVPAATSARSPRA